MKWWDRSWNPCFGCIPCSEGCINCVALETLQNQKRPLSPAFNEEVAKNNLYSHLNYAVCSLGDLFYPKYKFSQIDQVFSNMAKYPDNRYFILTKWSKEMKEYFSDEDFPDNLKTQLDGWDALWMGVSVENARHLDRIQDLLDTPLIKHRFIALEPLLEKISIETYLSTGKIDWVIVGSETGEKRRPAAWEWIQTIVGECKKFQVPVYVSQVEVDGSLVKTPEQFPLALQYREVPWKTFNTAFAGYDTLFVLDHEGMIGLKVEEKDENLVMLHFLVQAPRFVFHALKRGELGFLLSKEELLTPIQYLSSKGTLEMRKLFRDAHEYLNQKYFQLKAKRAPEKWVDMLLPEDVLVRFQWNIPVDLNYPETIPSFDESAEKIVEVKRYLTSFNYLIEKFRESNSK